MLRRPFRRACAADSGKSGFSQPTPTREISSIPTNETTSVTSVVLPVTTPPKNDNVPRRDPIDLMHSGPTRCVGTNDQDYFPSPLTVQSVLDWSDFVVVGTVTSQRESVLPRSEIPGTISDLKISSVVKSRGRIGVPKVVPWFSFSALDSSTGTFRCAYHDPAPIVGETYLVAIYEVGGVFSAVRGAGATAALLVDKNGLVHSIGSVVEDGRRVPFGASATFDNKPLSDVTKNYESMVQGPDPLGEARKFDEAHSSDPVTPTTFAK